MRTHTVTIHGRRLAYRTAGDEGPVVALIHGITQHAGTWEALSGPLARSARLIAPDLPGHGGSASPPGDHSLGAYACAVRDLLLTLDHGRVTVAGHSLGGGVALQFAYQFPEMVERLVLIDSGGLGRDVSPLLRAATLPGAGPALTVLSSEPIGSVVTGVARRLRRLGLPVGYDVDQIWAGIRGLADRHVRDAFLATVQAVIDRGGQRISAQDRLYLAAHVPTLIVWGGRDRIIPVAHAAAAHDAVAGSRLEVLPEAGHFPHVDEPERVARLIADFLASTEPADVPRERWGAIVRAGASALAAGQEPSPAR